MSGSTKNNSVLVYIAAFILTIFIALPLALVTQNTELGLFDECFEEPCETPNLLADLE